MKRNLFIISLCLINIMSFSCKKDNNNTNVIPLISTTLTYNNGKLLYKDTFVYNMDNKLSYYSYTYNNSFSNFDYHEQYNYVGNNLIICKKYMYNNLNLNISIDSMTLNGNGFCILDRQNSGEGNGFSLTNYKYNSDGYRIEFDHSDSFFNPFVGTINTIKYIISGKNTIIDTIKRNDNSIDIERYEYYTDKTNTIGNENNGKTFMGKQDINLIKIYISNSDSVIYNYEFDKKGRVINIINSNNENVIIKYL